MRVRGKVWLPASAPAFGSLHPRSRTAMSQPILSARRYGRSLFAALAGASLMACSESGGDGGTLPPGHRAAVIQLVSSNPQPGVAGQKLPETVRVRVVDQAGVPLEGVNVTFSVTEGGGSFLFGGQNTDAQGFAQATWTLGPSGAQRAVVQASGRVDAVQLQAGIVPVSATAAPMLGDLAEYMGSTIASQEQLIPRNQHVVSYIQAKLAMLRTPGLAGDIVANHRYVERTAATRSGRTVPITSVFPLEAMRGEAEQTVRVAESAIPVLEDFLDTDFTAPFFRIWYGFGIGSSTGGITMQAEDRTTYQSRMMPGTLPHDAMIMHEVSHGYMGHESLNQFLELYAWNVLATGSQDPLEWTWTRSWEPGLESNQGIHAILDVYRLIGPRAMGAGYRALMAHRPRYGSVLSAPLRDDFVAAVPEPLRAQVAAKLSKVTT